MFLISSVQYCGSPTLRSKTRGRRAHTKIRSREHTRILFYISGETGFRLAAPSLVSTIRGSCVLNLIYLAACSGLSLHSVIAQRAASCDSRTRAVIRRDTCFLNPRQGTENPAKHTSRRPPHCLQQLEMIYVLILTAVYQSMLFGSCNNTRVIG